MTKVHLSNDTVELESVSIEGLLTLIFNIDPDTDLGYSEGVWTAKTLLIDELIRRLKDAEMVDSSFEFVPMGLGISFVEQEETE